MGILKFLLYFCVLSLPAGMILRIQYVDGLAINYIDTVILLTSFLGFIYYAIKKDLEFKYKNEAALFLLICLISLIVNIPFLGTSKLLISSLYLLRLMSYFLIFVLISKQTKKIKERLMDLMFLSAFIFSVLGFVQLAFYPYLRNLAYLGWDVHLYRLVSSFLDPNFAGVFFGINAIILFNLVWDKYRLKKQFDLIKIPLLITSLISLVLTYSRGAMLAFVIAFVINVVLIGRKKLLLPLVGFLIIVIVFFLLTARSEGTNILRVTSSIGRVQSYKEGFVIFKDHPIFGVGFNAYRFAAQKYNFPSDKYSFPQHGLSGNDNSFLFILDTVGIVGFIAFIFFWKKVLKDLWRERTKNYSSPIICIILLVFASSFFINALFFPIIMFYIFLLMGVRENK